MVAGFSPLLEAEAVREEVLVSPHGCWELKHPSQGAVYTAQVAVQLPSSMVSSVPGPGGLTGPGWPELEDRNASLDSHRPKGILSEWAWGSSLQGWGVQAHVTADGGSSSCWRACEHFSSTFSLQLSSV